MIYHYRKTIVRALLLACLGVLVACSRPQSVADSPAASAKTNVPPATQPATTKRYALTGRVVSVDKASQSINIDGDEIPGFMSAMQMPYPVKDAILLTKVAPGNKIKAEIVMGGDGAYLENIVVDNTPARVPAK